MATAHISTKGFTGDGVAYIARLVTTLRLHCSRRREVMANLPLTTN